MYRRRPLLPRLRHPGGLGRAWLGVVLALALALKLMVPQGWMPGRSGGLILCPSGGPVLAMAGMQHGGKEMPAHPAGDHPCAFTGLGVAPVPPAPLAAAMPPVAARPHFAVQRVAVAVGRGLAAPPPPATGPPSFA